MIPNDYEGSRVELISILVEQGEEPAFLRRHRKVVEAQQQFWGHIANEQRKRRSTCEDLLLVLRRKVAGRWNLLADLLVQPSEWRVLEHWWQSWGLSEQVTRSNPYADQWFWSRQRALRKLLHALKRFNATWELYLYTKTLDPINGVIDAYNQYYPLEKSCAFGIEDVSRLGFEAISRISRSQLRQQFPALELPELRHHRFFQAGLR